MSLEVDLNIVSPKTIAFIVSCLEKRRMADMKHLLKMVGMAIIERKGYKIMLVMSVAHTIWQ